MSSAPIVSADPHQSRVFEGQGRTRRVASLGVGTVLFGGVAAFLWLEVAADGGRLLPIVFTVAALIIAAGFIRALRGLSAPLVRVTLTPARFRQSDEVELAWEAAGDAAVERLRLAVVEVRVVRRGSDGVRKPIARHELVDVQGTPAARGSLRAPFPAVSEGPRMRREEREFELVVETETAHGDGGRDTYPLGAVGPR